VSGEARVRVMRDMKAVRMLRRRCIMGCGPLAVSRLKDVREKCSCGTKSNSIDLTSINPGDCDIDLHTISLSREKTAKTSRPRPDTI
jgi:hypothetical protein